MRERLAERARQLSTHAFRLLSLKLIGTGLRTEHHHYVNTDFTYMRKASMTLHSFAY